MRKSTGILAVILYILAMPFLIVASVVKRQP